jgi:hypothetical protein
MYKLIFTHPKTSTWGCVSVNEKAITFPRVSMKKTIYMASRLLHLFTQHGFQMQKNQWMVFSFFL